MNDENIYKFLGLAQKAGCLLSGNEQLHAGLRNKKGCLLLIAEDTAENTAKEYREMAERQNISWCTFGEKEKLGEALGKGVRTAVLVTDKGFGAAVMKKLAARR